MRRFLATFLLAAAMPSFASATGNADCVIDEPGLSVTFESLYSYDGAFILLQPRAVLEISDPRFAPETWRVKMDQSNLRKQHFPGNALDLILHARHHSDELVLAIETLRKSEDDSEFEGRYRLAIGAKVSSDVTADGYLRTGRVSCTAG